MDVRLISAWLVLAASACGCGGGDDGDPMRMGGGPPSDMDASGGDAGVEADGETPMDAPIADGGAVDAGDPGMDAGAAGDAGGSADAGIDAGVDAMVEVDAGPPCIDPESCDDGIWCNGTESCDPILGCVAGVPVAVDDGVACTMDRCDEAARSVVHTPDDAPCDDGVFCNGAEVCDGTAGCLAGAPPAVDDGLACTVDGCDEAGRSVVHTPDDAPCDDGLWCNGAEVCDAAVGCRAGASPSLDDGHACTMDRCDEATDMVVHTPDDTRCDDGLWCNGPERCDPTLGCRPGAAPPPGDGVACTVDRCDEPTDTIVHTPNDAACADTNICDGDDRCDVALGCQPGTSAPAGTSCEGQLSCRMDETCDGAGACSPTSGTGIVCPDLGDACTDPTCRESGGGCTTTPHAFTVTGNLTMRGIDGCRMNLDFTLAGMTCGAVRTVGSCSLQTGTCAINSTGQVQAVLRRVGTFYGPLVSSGCSSTSIGSPLAEPTTLSCCI